MLLIVPFASEVVCCSPAAAQFRRYAALKSIYGSLDSFSGLHTGLLSCLRSRRLFRPPTTRSYARLDPHPGHRVPGDRWRHELRQVRTERRMALVDLLHCADAAGSFLAASVFQDEPSRSACVLVVGASCRPRLCICSSRCWSDGRTTCRFWKYRHYGSCWAEGGYPTDI